MGDGFNPPDDKDWNAYLTETSYTITGLEPGVQYRVQVGARYSESPTQWSEQVRRRVAANPTSTPTATPTATPTPTPTPDGLITGVTLTSDEPGTLTIRWDAASPAPGDYRVNWARADEAFPSWQDDEGNAYPTSNSYTLSALDEGSEYKVQVRSRYFDENGDLENSGPWSEEGRLTVAVQQDVVLRNSEDVTEETLKNRKVGPRQSINGPTVTIAGGEGVTVVEEVNQVDGAAFDVLITFSAAVGDTFEHTDITLTHAQTLTTTDIITSTSGLTYTATIRPTAGFTGAFTVQVPADVAQDASNQDNQASNVFTATVTVQSACVTGGAGPSR